MNRPLRMEEIKPVLERVGFDSKETERCMLWTHPRMSCPLSGDDRILAELSPEEQAFFRCVGYAYEEKGVDPLRLAALHETFWIAMRALHDLPLSDLAVKEGKYIVAT